MKRIPIYLSIVVAAALLFQCSNKKSSDSAADEQAEDTGVETAISLSAVPESPVYQDAILQMNTPEENGTTADNAVTFSYEVKNYTLATQTADADIKMCANSAEGQHIHLILNNQPYTAHYEAEFDMDLESGHYVALSFLSRSYHESIKNPEAYVLRQFTVGDVEAAPVNLNAPHLFYSRPKGTYSGEDTRKVLLDFYLVNADLSEDGYKVRATINGEEFMFTEWKPMFIEGLPMGTSTIKLEFLDANGDLVESPYNPVERTITLEEAQQPA